MPSYTTTKNTEEFNKEIPRRSLSFIQETFVGLIIHQTVQVQWWSRGQIVASMELISVSESAGSCVVGAWLNITHSWVTDTGLFSLAYPVLWLGSPWKWGKKQSGHKKQPPTVPKRSSGRFFLNTSPIYSTSLSSISIWFCCSCLMVLFH